MNEAGHCDYCNGLFVQGGPCHVLGLCDAVHLGPTKNKTTTYTFCSNKCLKSWVRRNLD